ncbi:MAG: DNA alkylation repair protein [Butyrivibrio sp.]
MPKYTSEEIKAELLSLRDSKYGEFSSALIPGENSLIGVRIPLLRKFAKEIAAGDYMYYLDNACNEMIYFEEIMLKGMVIGSIKTDEDTLFGLIKGFVPLINNWSVNDSFCAGLKAVKKYPDRTWKFLQPYLESEEEFPLRFGIIMLMDYFLTDEYAKRAIEKVSILCHESYYARMGMAWFMSTAYAKYPEITLESLKNSNFDDWTYNKAIQKMLESYRISDRDKEFLRSMKRNIHNF